MALRWRPQSESGRKVIRNPGETGWGLRVGTFPALRNYLTAM